MFGRTSSERVSLLGPHQSCCKSCMKASSPVLFQERMASWRPDDPASIRISNLSSEDAITWSVFGPIVYAPSRRRADFVRELLESIDVDARIKHAANVWLWRRIPHPDNL